MGKSLQKTISKLANSCKNIQKNIKNVPTGTHKKRQILFHQFLRKYTLFLTPYFFWRGNENSKKLGRTGTNFFKNHQVKRRREREITFVRWSDFFILICSLLVVMVTDTAFRKSTLENLFLKVVVPGTSKHWLYHTDLLVSVLNLDFHLFASTWTSTIT